MNKDELQKAVVERVKKLASIPYRRQLRSLRSIDEMRFWQIQLERFKATYSDALEHVSYYKARNDLYSDAPLEVNHILEALAMLPILDKPTVKSNPQEFYRTPKRFITAEHTTGGTTGTPLKIRASLMERGYTNAILEERNFELTGELNPRTVRLSGFLQSEQETGEIFRTIPGTPFAYLSIYDLNLDHKEQIRQLVEEFQPKMFHGYASALHQFSLLFSEDSPLQLSTRPVVISTSETLFDHQREVIEQRLGALVLNEYGSQEGQHMVQECIEHRMHIHPTRGVVEILDRATNRRVAAGERGEVVVTGLMNSSMPLIRYRIGDSAISTGYETNCPCGLHWPTIGRVDGRTEDLIRTRDGRRIGLLAHSTLKDLDGIRESQIIQRDFDEFIFLIALESGYERDAKAIEDHISRQMFARVSPYVSIEFRYVDSVPRTAAGKVRAVIVDFDEDSGFPRGDE